MLASGLAVPIAAAVGTRARARALDPVKVVIPENSVFVLSWLGAKDAGVFEKHGIDLEVDVRPFAGFLAGLPSKECMATTYSGIDAIEKINQGVDWAIIGGGLTLMEDVIVRNELALPKGHRPAREEIRHLLDRRGLVQSSAGGDHRRRRL